ncbi:hypothetical protein BV394_03270 [Brevirhabdus pacifica]|uniref:Uncharacterized protein n=1 Tax=Brevirhabdus pacifica TaxID=1267768 RepID=A0A1U7DG41_9RHOB|nr:hypothetical protein [Brevirhabdus pacifica]APX88869.1 hypothetical protein BV394_03270 [Brevirhabdus pacifica]PJJ86589.1 hypothetical protein CLV77_1139 [Brevirhabdus pacifica]
MTKLYRSLLAHGLYGFMMAAGFVSVLLVLNVANLWEVVTSSDEGLVAAGMLLLFNAIAFTSIRFLIHSARDRMDRRPSGSRSALPARAAIPVYAPARR